ncbi:hypothetical protein VPH35_062961 [Triticum aestivum]
MVHEVYSQQFKNDFTHFLKLRAKGMAPRGWMIISIIGRPSDGSTFEFLHTWEVIAQTLSIMASEHFGDMMDEFTGIGKWYWSLEGNLQEMLAKDTLVAVSLSKTAMKIKNHMKY